MNNKEKQQFQAASLPVNTSPAQRGTISAHPKGFGFVTTEGEGFFVPPPQMANLVPGDIVDYNLVTNPRNQMVQASIVRVVERPQSFWLGSVQTDAKGQNWLVTDEACPVNLKLTDLPVQLEAEDVIQAELPLGSPTGTDVLQVHFVQNLGKRSVDDFDVRYAVAKWRMDSEFPVILAEELAGLREPTQAVLPDGREVEDFTVLEFVTIDGESTRDFDDAVCLVRGPKGSTLHVAIADVSAYVRPGTELDKVALSRSTSVYFMDRTLPMLPEALSNGVCSLQPGKLRLAVVCSMEYDLDGRQTGYRFHRALIRSAARLTYTQVAQRDVPAHVSELVSELYAWYESQKPRRELRGLVEYRQQEPKLVVNAEGTRAIGWIAPTSAHELIEECMLAANRSAAAHMALLGRGSLFRHQQGLDRIKWADNRAWLATQGIDAPELPTLTDLRDLLESLEAHPLKSQVEFRVQRSMSPASYDDLNSSHFSLGFAAYTHFTSPIRRYADLMVHRLLLGEISEVSDAVLTHLGIKAKTAKVASRYPMERFKRHQLWAAGGPWGGMPVYDTQVVSMSPKGLKAAVTDWETLVAVDAEELEANGYRWNKSLERWESAESVLDLGVRFSIRLKGLRQKAQELELLAVPVERVAS